MPETITGRSLSSRTCERCGEQGNGYQGPVMSTFDGEMHEECGANYRAEQRMKNGSLRDQMLADIRKGR